MNENLPFSRHVSTHKMLCWQITSYCNRNCEFCIADAIHGRPKETIDRFAILDRIHLLGVEKLSISGGEPFLVPELELLVLNWKEFGKEVQLTTNGDYLLKSLPEWIIVNKIPVNISFYGNETTHNEVMGLLHFERLMSFARQYAGTISLGANFVLSNRNLNQVEGFIQLAYESGFHRVLLIAYMPIGDPAIDEKYYFDGLQEEIQRIRHFINSQGLHFAQGIRLHNYRNEDFFLVCSEKGNVYITGEGRSNDTWVGNIFQNDWPHPTAGVISSKEALKLYWEKRLHTESIILISESK